MSAPVTEPELTQLATGARFHGRYDVVRCIKTGGMGAVYEVIHAETRRRAALKVMLPSVVANPDMRARFKLESRSIRSWARRLMAGVKKRSRNAMSRLNVVKSR